MRMKTLWMIACSHPGWKNRGDDGLEEAARIEIDRGQELGLGRKEIIDEVARMLYKRDLQDLGFALDLAFLPFESYLQDAAGLADCLMPPETKVIPFPGSGQRSA